VKTARLVGRADVAEEIVQGAFLKLWDAGMTFRDDRAAFAWVYRTCHNAGLDHLRSHATRFESGAAAAELEGGVDVAGGSPLAELEARQWLARQLLKLDEREAQILGYRALDGLTQQEIAEVMGLSRKTIVRACADIDAKLGGEPYFGDGGVDA
jgi:RNA polymerase sigma-70 factor (ECF subfamily)